MSAPDVARDPDPPARRPDKPAAVPRLKRRGDFLRLSSARNRWVAPGFILQAAPNPTARHAPRPPAARVGFTVSRKVGNAVVRNRARRRLRAAATLVLPEAGRPGWDYVLIGRQETNAQVFATLVADLRRAVERVSTAQRGQTGRGHRGKGEKSGKNQTGGKAGADGKGHTPTGGRG